MTATPDRVPVADPDTVRRGARRGIRATVIVQLLLTGFTASGTAMLLRGDHYGIPFAVGGAASQLASLALTVGGLRVSGSLRDDTVSRTALATAVRIFTTTWVALLVTAIVLGAYAVVRLAAGDPWPLLTTAVIGVPLLLLLRGARRLRDGGHALLAAPGGPGSVR